MEVIHTELYMKVYDFVWYVDELFFFSKLIDDK